MFLAKDLLEYDPELEPAMRFVFGNILICTSDDAAKKVGFEFFVSSFYSTLHVITPFGILHLRLLFVHPRRICWSFLICLFVFCFLFSKHVV